MPDSRVEHPTITTNHIIIVRTPRIFAVTRSFRRLGAVVVLSTAALYHCFIIMDTISNP